MVEVYPIKLYVTMPRAFKASLQIVVFTTRRTKGNVLLRAAVDAFMRMQDIEGSSDDEEIKDGGPEDGGLPPIQESESKAVEITIPPPEDLPSEPPSLTSPARYTEARLKFGSLTIKDGTELTLEKMRVSNFAQGTLETEDTVTTTPPRGSTGAGASAGAISLYGTTIYTSASGYSGSTGYSWARQRAVRAWWALAIWATPAS